MSVLFLVPGISLKPGRTQHQQEVNRTRTIIKTTYWALVDSGDVFKGDVIEKQLSRYDERGNLIEFNWYNSDGNLELTLSYTYDVEANIIERKKYYYGSLYKKHIYSYNEKGHVIEEKWYGSHGTLEDSATSTYDEKGNRVEWTLFKSDGTLTKVATYKYDDKGNVIEEYYTYPGGIIESKYTYTYNDQRKIIEVNRFKSDGTLEDKRTYKYDVKGNRIEMRWYYNGIEEYIFTYVYEYNMQCKWAKIIEYRDTVPETITEREIEYYK